MITQKQIDNDFDRLLVDPVRDLVATIQSMPEAEVDGPLALLEMRLRYALQAYDSSKGEL